jgi:hypothetical protein
MAKCRRLLQENEDLGKIISSGNVAQLEHDLAYHKQLINEASANEQNISSFLLEVDNQMDLMHATVFKLKETQGGAHDLSNEAVSDVSDNVVAAARDFLNSEIDKSSEKMEDT